MDGSLRSGHQAGGQALATPVPRLHRQAPRCVSSSGLHDMTAGDVRVRGDGVDSDMNEKAGPHHAAFDAFTKSQENEELFSPPSMRASAPGTAACKPPTPPNRLLAALFPGTPTCTATHWRREQADREWPPGCEGGQDNGFEDNSEALMVGKSLVDVTVHRNLSDLPPKPVLSSVTRLPPMKSARSVSVTDRSLRCFSTQPQASAHSLLARSHFTSRHSSPGRAAGCLVPSTGILDRGPFPRSCFTSQDAGPSKYSAPHMPRPLGPCEIVAAAVACIANGQLPAEEEVLVLQDPPEEDPMPRFTLPLHDGSPALLHNSSSSSSIFADDPTAPRMRLSHSSPRCKSRDSTPQRELSSQHPLRFGSSQTQILTAGRFSRDPSPAGWRDSGTPPLPRGPPSCRSREASPVHQSWASGGGRSSRDASPQTRTSCLGTPQSQLSHQDSRIIKPGLTRAEQEARTRQMHPPRAPLQYERRNQGHAAERLGLELPHLAKSYMFFKPQETFTLVTEEEYKKGHL